MLVICVHNSVHVYVEEQRIVWCNISTQQLSSS